jgi:hypothetical protein
MNFIVKTDDDLVIPLFMLSKQEPSEQSLVSLLLIGQRLIINEIKYNE